MATRSRRSVLAKADTSKNVTTDSPKTVGPSTRRQSSYVNSDDVTSNTKKEHSFDPLEGIYDDEVVTPKTPKTPRGGNKKKLNNNEIANLVNSDDDNEKLYNPSSKNKTGGKKQNEYTCSILDPREDAETIRIKISLIKNDEIVDCLIGAKESRKVDNRSTETPRKLRRTMGDVKSYNEDELMENHHQKCLEDINRTLSKGHKRNKLEAPKNATEISPRKRSQQNGKQQESEDYGVDENEMSHANHISSPPKRSKSEIGIEQTPKKKPELVDVKSTPKSAAKRKINLSPERNNVNSRRNTRQSTAQCTANYKDWSSSDDNTTKTGLLEPTISITKLDPKSLMKRTNKKSSKNAKTHESEDSDIEGRRNTRSRSISLQPSVKNVVEPTYSPTKDMQKMSLNTPKKVSRLKLKIKSTSPTGIQSNIDKQENAQRKSQRITQQRYEIQKYSDEESADSSDDYKAEEDDSDTDEPSSSSGNDSADDFQSPIRRGRSMKTPRKNSAAPKANKRVSKVSMDTPTKAISRMSIGTPSLDRHRRVTSIIKPSTPLQEARVKLHVSALPKSLPCREEQFNDIYSFLHARLSDGSGGCIYISGVPGTGKTATVSEVIRCLKKAVTKGELPEFDYVDINGLKLSEPRQAYVQIWRQLSKETKTWEESQKLLHNKFTKSNAKRRMTLLLVDELDMLCTKRQDVVYNLLDWPSKTNAKLVVVTIANTMDLPERILMGKVTSRLGLTRLTFPPYNFKQLEEIVVSRLRGFNAFGGETIQLVARKVAAVSGDARRALDICRRSAEIAEKNKNDLVTMGDVKQALDEMIASPKIRAIRGCSEMEKYFLQAVCAEVQRTGVEEVVFKNVYMLMETLCAVDGLKAPNVSIALEICAGLGSYRLLVTDHSRMDILQRLLLNVSPDDVHFATKNIET